MDADSLRSVARACPEAFATVLEETVRSFTRRNPAPPALPFFGFDHPPGCGTRLLDRLSDLGIFRFYERVLDLGSGLGGPARWLARRRGCRVVSVSAERAALRGARLLNRRAHLDAQVAFVRAAPGRLPFPDATFTHVWSVEALHAHGDKAAILREAFRVVRPGGQVAVQDWVRSGPEDSALAGRFDPLEVYRQGFSDAGFVEIRHSFVDELLEGSSAAGEILAGRLGDALADRAAAANVEAERARNAVVSEARGAGRLRLAQCFAARPS